MTRLTKTIVASFTIMSALFVSQATAQTYRHIDRLAIDLQNATVDLADEVSHYQHTSNYRHMVEDVLSLNRDAIHIHELAHRQGSLRHLEADLASIDTAFHHIEGLFDKTEIDASYGYGHVHGSTQHVKRLLNQMGQLIHHLEDDIQELRRARRNGIYQNAGPVTYGNQGLSYGGYSTTRYGQRGTYSNRSNRGNYDSHGRHNGHGNRSSQHRSGFGISLGNGRLRINF